MKTNIRANWRRTTHRHLSDPQTERAVAETGSAIIARWDLKQGDATLKYVWEPDHENPYLLILEEADLRERFENRGDGGSRNKQVLRDPQILGDIKTFTCGAETEDEGQCEITVSGPENTCHHHSG